MSCREVEALCHAFLHKFEFSFLNGILMVSPGPRLIFNRIGKCCVPQKSAETILDGMTTPTLLTGANIK
jgi:hypothetical protein